MCDMKEERAIWAVKCLGGDGERVEGGVKSGLTKTNIA